MKNISIVIMTVITAMSLTSCASIVSGTNQSVSVKTGKITGANCELKNNKGKWYVSSTPGSVVVNRSYKNLEIECTKKGYPTGKESVKSHTKAMAFGNVILGGAVGGGVDIATGAAYDYPNEIDVPMQKLA